MIWMKGTFLSPQHLQTQDRFLETRFASRRRRCRFQPWGFHRFKIDQEALAGGDLAIADASGIFPDGLMFDIPNSDPAPPPVATRGLVRPGLGRTRRVPGHSSPAAARIQRIGSAARSRYPLSC